MQKQFLYLTLGLSLTSSLVAQKSLTETFDNFFSPENWNVEIHSNMDAKVNISDKDEKTLLIEIALPGINKNNIKFEIEEGMFSLEVKEKQEEVKTDKNYYKKEFSSQNINIKQSLGVKVIPETAKAEYKDGILKIEVQKQKVTSKKSQVVPIK